MLVPIQKEDELLCPGCGCVLQNITDHANNQEDTSNHTIHTSLNVHLLGSALQRNVKYAFPRTAQQSKEEQVYQNIIDITKQFNLPERLALETFNALKKKNRGFWSEKEPIKQLLKILSRDENYIHILKMRQIKTSYAKILNI